MLQPTVASAADAWPGCRCEGAAATLHPACLAAADYGGGLAARLFLGWIAWRLDRSTFTGSEALDQRLLDAGEAFGRRV